MINYYFVGENGEYSTIILLILVQVHQGILFEVTTQQRMLTNQYDSDINIRQKKISFTTCSPKQNEMSNASSHSSLPNESPS